MECEFFANLSCEKLFVYNRNRRDDMKKIPEVLLPLFSCGSCSRPFVNYLLEESFPESWKAFARVFRCIWKGEYEKALEAIEKALKLCESATARDILMAEKLSITRNLGKPDEKLYELLKKGFLSCRSWLEASLCQF